MKHAMKKFILSFTAKEREKKHFNQYKKIQMEFCSKTKEEQLLTYISLKVKYEHCKNIVFPIVAICWLFTVFKLLNAFLSYISNAIMYLVQKSDFIDKDIIEIGMVTLTILVGMIMIILIWFLATFTKYLLDLRKRFEVYKLIMNNNR
ncbi:MAG: hypothetical protein ACK5M0_06050 [Bacteroidales bacterium]